jgi:hypothetical protein
VLSYLLSKIVTFVFPKDQFSILVFDYNNFRLDNKWPFSFIDIIPDYLGALTLNHDNVIINIHNLL